MDSGREALDQHLKEAEALLQQKDFLAALARLESAWHFYPQDPSIIAMRERIQREQQEDSALKYERKMNEARSTLASGEEERAFVILEAILEESPTHTEARLLRDQIIDSRWQKLQEQIQQGLELSMQPLAFCDFEVASGLLLKLRNEIEIDSCSLEIERIRKAIDSLQSAFTSAEYWEVQDIISKLMSKDRFGWLSPHSQIFSAVQQAADEKLLLRRSKMQQAQSLVADMNWESALECWKDVLDHFPNDPEAQSSLRTVQDHLTQERKIQSELLFQLKNCYSKIMKKQFDEAQTLLDRMLEKIQPGYRLLKMEEQIQKLQNEIARQIQIQKRHSLAIGERLQEIQKMYREGALSEAMENLSSILDEEFVPEEALSLKDSIEKAIQQQQLSQRFRWAFQKGKEYFENRRWQKAIEFWKKAASIADDSVLKGWISQAEERLKKERQIRLSIIAMLAEIDELIFYGNFDAARKKLGKCIRALSREFFLEDLANQIEATANKLDLEIRKEQDLRSSLQTELEDAMLLYQQRFYEQAKERLDHVLKQHPELEPAMQLRAQIEAAEAENRNVLDTIGAIVKLVVRKEFKQLPAFLMRLRDTSAKTPYAEDGASIVEDLPLLVLEIESGDVEGMRQRLDQLFSRSLVFLQYKKTLLAFADSLESEKAAESYLESVLHEGLQEIEAGQPDAAVQCMLKFETMITAALPQDRRKSGIAVERTIALSDPEFRISEAELEVLELELHKNELRQMLSRAASMLQAGNPEEAKLLYERVLQTDPENTIALNALRNL